MKWECINCEVELKQHEVTEEFFGDQSFRYCNRCGFRSVSRVYEPLAPRAAVPRPKRFCLFIKPKDDYPEKYTRCEEFFLALRIGYFKEAWRMLCGKRSSYFWEGTENSPFPF